jgi:hypothetical protein
MKFVSIFLLSFLLVFLFDHVHGKTAAGPGISLKSSLSLKSKEISTQSKFTQFRGGKTIGPITPERVLLSSVILQATVFVYYMTTNGDFLLKNVLLGRSATPTELFFIRVFALGINFLGVTLWRLKDKIGTSEALKIEALSHFVRVPLIASKYIKGGFFATHLPLIGHLVVPALLYLFST